MTREEAIEILTKISCALGTMAVEYLSEKDGEKMREAIKVLEQEPFVNKPCISKGACHEDKNVVLNKIRAEIEQEIERERFARSVFRGEEKDYTKAEQCTGSIMAYNDVIRLIDKYTTERSEKE